MTFRLTALVGVTLLRGTGHSDGYQSIHCISAGKTDQSLKTLDERMPANPKVKIVSNKSGNKISITPSEPHAEPENLASLKREITLLTI